MLKHLIPFRNQYIVFVFFLVAAPVASAQELSRYDTSKPIDITADSLEVLQKDQLARFSGHVLATQGKITLKAAVMTVHYRTHGQDDDGQKTHGQDDDGQKTHGQSVSRIEVAGGVLLATPTESAQGSKGLYDVDAKKITLNEHVVLTKGENVVKGDTLTYDLNTGRSQIVGSAEMSAQNPDGKKGRVHGLFVPEEKGKAR